MSEDGLRIVLARIEGELAVIRAQQEANKEAAERRYEQTLDATEQARQTAELARLAAEQGRLSIMQAAIDTKDALKELAGKTATKEQIDYLTERVEKVEGTQTWVTRGIVGTVGIGVAGMLGLSRKIGF
ncbi:MAG: hypothetical protein M3R04_07035 [bacterium]|nr:hypothetical protein [bacterium]